MNADDEPPEWLGAGSVYWAETIEELQLRAMLGRVSRLQLAIYCQLLRQYVTATEFLNANGFVVSIRDEKGAVTKEVVAPEFAVQRDALARLRQFWGDWCLMPRVVAVVKNDRNKRVADLVERLRSGVRGADTGGAGGSVGGSARRRKSVRK